MSLRESKRRWVGKTALISAALCAPALAAAAFAPEATTAEFRSATRGGLTDRFLASHPSMTVDDRGRPIVAWQDFTSHEVIYVRRWVGPSQPWSPMGRSDSDIGLGLRGQPALNPIVIAEQGPGMVVAWEQVIDDQVQIYLKRWDGRRWSPLGRSASGGGVSNAAQTARAPSMALDDDMYPVLAWETAEGIFVRRWNGETWIELGGSASGMGIADRAEGMAPTLALDSSGNPHVAWSQPAPGLAGKSAQVMLKRWDGRAWVGVGSSATSIGVSNTGSAQQPSLALDSKGRPYLAWADHSRGNYEVYVRGWNGRAWMELGGSATDGGISDTKPSSWQPNIQLDDKERPVVVWGEYFQNIYAARWDGKRWLRLGGRNKRGNLSNTKGWSNHASMFLSKRKKPRGGWTGVPVVAWADDTSTRRNIYLRFWDGFGWNELEGVPGGAAVAEGPTGLPPQQLFPPDGQLVGNGQDVTLKWHGGNAPFQVQLSRDLRFERGVTEKSASDPSLTWTAEGTETVYWRVKSVGTRESERSEFSRPWRLLVDNFPGVRRFGEPITDDDKKKGGGLELLVVDSPPPTYVTSRSKVRVAGKVPYGATVRVGGKTIATKGGGRFEHSFPLSVGINAIVVEAQLRGGQRAFETRYVVFKSTR